MNENALSKKIVSMVLIMSIMLTMFVMPTNAIATETLIIGGVIASFLASCGVAIMSPNMNSQGLATVLYDQWKKQNDQWLESARITDEEFLASVGATNGKLQIENKLSKALSNFTEANSGQNISGGFTVDGKAVNIPFIPLDATQIKYNPQFTSQSVLEYGGSKYTFKFVSTGINGKAAYTFYPYGSTTYITGVVQENFTSYRNPTLSQEDRFMLFITQISSGEYRIGTLTDRSAHTPMYAEASDYRLRIRYSYPFGRDWTPDFAYLSEKLTLPTQTLQDDETTVIEIPDVTGTTVADIATQAIDKAQAGTLTATYTNKIPVPPVPETDMSWIKGFHSIWEYVERMVESVGSAIRFIPQMIQAMPTEVSVFIFGAFVLLLFGGVISKLLQ